jgi:VWFA-related protein
MAGINRSVCRLSLRNQVFPSFLLALLVAGLLGLPFPAAAQSQSTPPASANPNQQQAPPEAGGPQTDVGPIAIPKKKDEAPPPPPPEKPKKIEGMPDYSLRVDVPVVNVDVMVTTKDGQFVPGLKKENFRVSEDGVAQNIANFNITDAPITCVLLMEFASTNYYFVNEALNSSYTFASTLKKDDWVAVVTYDMKPHILVDFTQDKRAVFGSLNQLYFPGFAETNLFDALYDTIDRVDSIEGRKYIILISTGVDTFSKLNLDQMLKKLKGTHDISIFPVSVGRAVREYYESHGRTASHGMGIPISNMDYLQADNQLNTFARMTGGRAYFPRFEGELPEIFRDIAGDIRNQYLLAYHPTNAKQDGTYRKIKIDLVGTDGGPLKVRDQKGKDVKVQIVAREGYTAKHVVE